MHARPLSLILVLMAGAAAGQESRTESIGCDDALQALEAREAQLAAERPDAEPDPGMRPVPDAKLEALRRRASVACLGGRSTAPPQRQRFAEPPVSVPPVAVPPPGAARASPPRRMLPAAPPPQARRPTAITSCDPLGCWANDGSRLNGMGPNLVGERGVCKANGKLLRCP